ANILLSRGHALVTDFGVAKLLDARAEPGQDSLTGTGFAPGTAEYMSPEQAAGERRLDARSDVYALAAVLYEMLAGAPPFTAPTAQAVVARILVEPPPRLRGARRPAAGASGAVAAPSGAAHGRGGARGTRGARRARRAARTEALAPGPAAARAPRRDGARPRRRLRRGRRPLARARHRAARRVLPRLDRGDGRRLRPLSRGDRRRAAVGRAAARPVARDRRALGR